MREKSVNMSWAVRDWTACFLACGISLEEDEKPNRLCSSSSAQAPDKKLVLRSNKRLHRNNKTDGDYEKENHTQNSICSLVKTQDTGPTQKEPNFDDEDYIVFGFTKDGTIRVVEDDDDEKTESSTHGYRVNRSSKRNIRTKIVFGEHEERVTSSYHEVHDCSLNEDEEGNNFKTNESKSNVCREEEKIECNTKSVTAIGMSKGEEHYSEKSEAYETGSAEKSESLQSDGSSSSFAFPELNWEEIGSPKQMHTPDLMQQLTKQKTYYTVHSHSCRF